jgi:hypothetical protein
MTIQNTPYTDIQQRPARIRVLVELPPEEFAAIERNLQHVPDWERYFIMNNPVSWPEGMYAVVQQYVEINPAPMTD